MVRSPSLAVRVLTLLGLLALTLGAFAGAGRNGWFDIDDGAYVYENPHVKDGLSPAALAWTWTHADVGNYAPLTMTSHLIDVSLFGLRPGGHHAMSVALHAVNAALLLLVLAGYTGAWWRPAIVAALFAVHPLRVESVAWAADRKDLLAGLFFLLTLEAWRRWTSRPDAARYALVVLALLAGLLSKAMLVGTPVVLLLLDAWPLGRLRSRAELGARIAEKWPLWLMVAAFTIGTAATQGSAGALTIIPGLTWPLRASNALRTIAIYAGQFAWPQGLAAFVAHDLQPHLFTALASLAGILTITFLVLRAPKRPWLGVGWLWYLVLLLPVLGFVQIGPHARADRFTYLPSIGLALAVAWELGERAGRSRPARMLLGGLAVAAIAALTAATLRQLPYWRDTRTMYERILAVYPKTTNIRWWLGDLHMKDGDAAGALPLYEQAVREAPSYAALRTSTANALVQLGRLPEARAHLAFAAASRPSPDAWRNLAGVDARMGDTAAAAAELDSALALAPDDRTTQSAIALLLTRTRRPVAALDAAAAAVYAGAGRWDEAIAAAGNAVAEARAAGADAAVYEARLAAYRARRLE